MKFKAKLTNLLCRSNFQASKKSSESLGFFFLLLLLFLLLLVFLLFFFKYSLNLNFFFFFLSIVPPAGTQHCSVEIALVKWRVHRPFSVK